MGRFRVGDRSLDPSPFENHKLLYVSLEMLGTRGRSRISGKGVYNNKGVGIRFAYFISFFLKYLTLVSL